VNSSIRRAFLALALVLMSTVAYTIPASTQGTGCYTCLMSCPTSSGDGETYCEFYCNIVGADWSCDDDEVCPQDWIQLNCFESQPH